VDPAKFGALIRTLEQRSRQRPRLYRVQVGSLAALGYLYVVGLMSLLLASMIGLGYLAIYVGGGAIAVKLAIPLGGLVYVLVRSLWIRVPEVHGIPLTVERCPTLMDMLERLRARVDGPRFHRVLLDGTFNAGVAQRPRLGLLGPSINDLVLGLPLMQALPPLEFEAVLAHELGHVSRQHGRFGHWVYRVRSTWSRLAAVVDANPGWEVRLLVGRFLGWYAPFFNAYSFVLARQDEYEADRLAAEVAGPTVLARSLVRIELVGRFHAERYWGRLSSELASRTELPSPFADFAGAISTQLDPVDVESWLGQALRRETDYADTHPSLADRLQAIGNQTAPALPDPFAHSAATVLLGPECDVLATELDTRWRTAVEPQLTQARTELEAARRRLEELDAMEELDRDASWERALLLDRLGQRAEAKAAAESVVARQSDHLAALFFLGRLRLEDDQHDGIPLLERAAALHPPAAPAVQSLLFDYHWRHGRREEAEQARASLDQAGHRLETARRERASLAEDPVFVPHGLSPEVLDPLRLALANVPGLRAAYLVRRVVVEMPEVPCYFVGLTPDQRWWKLRREADNERLRAMVGGAVAWPESTFIVVGQGSNTRLVKRMQQVPGAELTSAGGDGSSTTESLDPAALEAMRGKLARRRAHG
jgi:tetratricopeptide (TPR) repeat protein